VPFHTVIRVAYIDQFAYQFVGERFDLLQILSVNQQGMGKTIVPDRSID
jgi:hypothetical protein